jgi:teichuronic acid biosynthesis glycosyltransferase TuaC
MLRVLTLSTLFPDENRPRFGSFVEQQTQKLAAHSDVELRVVAPIGLPPMPLALHPKYATLRALPTQEAWNGLTVYRPRFMHIPGTGGRFDAGLMARALLPLFRQIRCEFPFDVIDASFFFPDGPAATRLGEALHIPVSIKARGSDIRFWGRQAATAAQIRKASQQAAGLLAVSAALKADMVALDMQAEKIRVHYTGVDFTTFKPHPRAETKAALGLTGPLIVCIGNLIPGKRQGLILEALTHIPDATLAVIGRGPDQAKLQAQAADLGLLDRVRFVGSITHSDMAVWLSAADVMALASESEGLANVWVEALACGTPLAITDVGGAREVLDRPVAGHLISVDPAGIAEAIRDLIDHPRDPIAVRACAKRFTWEANTASLYDHLSGLVS